MSDAKHPDGEPWQWPEATWRRIVGRARAGRSLAPRAWPGGAAVRGGNLVRRRP